jgi:hypothetical protein
MGINLAFKELRNFQSLQLKENMYVKSKPNKKNISSKLKAGEEYNVKFEKYWR